MTLHAPEAPPGRVRAGTVEFTLLLAATMATTALAIDILLPAFGAIRTDLGLSADSTAVSGLITAFLLGVAGAQLVFGALADRFGRRPVLLWGLGLYIVGAVASALAPNLPLMIAARFVWGVGAAGPRVAALAVVRDSFEGERMARAMSSIMAIFILVPVVAPALGALLVRVGPWQLVFWTCAAMAVAVGFWTRRLPETLREENRRTLGARDLAAAVRTVVTHRSTLLHTFALTALFAGFVSYLATSELIVEEVLGLEGKFPLVFGAVAAVMGVSMLLNRRLVETVGLDRLISYGLAVYLLIAAVLLVTTLAVGGHPAWWVFVPLAGLLFGTHALLLPNLNSAAMRPMGEVAGLAAAVIGTISTALGALGGAVIDSFFDGSLTPLCIGFLACGVIATALVRAS